jgi:hypothetical protein
VPPLWPVAVAIDRICIVGKIYMTVFDTIDLSSVHDQPTHLIAVGKHCSEKFQQPSKTISIITIMTKKKINDKIAII